MVVFLLLVIIAILLFGSSAVLGVVGAVLGFVAMLAAIFTGLSAIAALTGRTVDDIFLPVVIGVPVLMLLAIAILGGLAWVVQSKRSNSPTIPRPSPTPDASVSRNAAATSVWDFFLPDIERFSPTERGHAENLCKAGEATELRRYCENVKRGLSGPCPPGYPDPRLKSGS